ncbi:MAG: glycosyltransferase [Hyphomonadaceae bacterium]
MKALLLHHPYVYPRFEQDFLSRVAELPEFDVAPVHLGALADGVLARSDGPVALARYDAVIVFVAFKALRTAPVLQWGGFGGLRVLLDHDIIQNYSDIFDPTLQGAWSEVFDRHLFTSVVTSGGAVRARLENDGIAADWVAKGFEPSRFADEDGARAGIVTYGSAYACRVLAERAVRDAGLPLTRVEMTPYPELGAVLGRYLACMAVSSDLDVPVSARAGLNDVLPAAVPMRPGLEPMAKFFESAGAGCCPIADDMEDLAVLGFRDGETVLSFRSHAELAEKLRLWFETPEKVRALGAAAARLAHAGHTWAHRARALRDALGRRLG